MTKRYFLDSDDDGHWYVVEEIKRKEWEAWLELDEDDENSWEAPKFAIPIDATSGVTFSEPDFSK